MACQWLDDTGLNRTKVAEKAGISKILDVEIWYYWNCKEKNYILATLVSEMQSNVKTVSGGKYIWMKFITGEKISCI